MLCTRELRTALNGSRFVLACKITGPSHFFYLSYLALNGLADWSLKAILWDPRLVLTCKITRPSRLFIPFVFTVLFLSRRGFPEFQAKNCLQKQNALAGSSASLKVTCYILESWGPHGMDIDLCGPAKSLGQAIISTPANVAFFGLADWSLKTLLWDPRLVLTCEITRPSRIFIPFVFAVLFLSSRGIPESQA